MAAGVVLVLEVAVVPDEVSAVAVAMSQGWETAAAETAPDWVQGMARVRGLAMATASAMGTDWARVMDWGWGRGALNEGSPSHRC